MNTTPQSNTWRSTRIEILIGRSAAMCAHPCAAWRTGTHRDRVGVLVAYAAAGYALVLGALLMQ